MPRQSTSDGLYRFVLAGSSEHSPQHVEMMKEALSWGEIERIFQGGEALEFPLLLLRQRMQDGANVIARGAKHEQPKCPDLRRFGINPREQIVGCSSIGLQRGAQKCAHNLCLPLPWLLGFFRNHELDCRKKPSRAWLLIVRLQKLTEFFDTLEFLLAASGKRIDL